MPARAQQVFRRVVCAMSGGVDSSVAALLLKKKGFEVIGVFMRNWDVHDETGKCQADYELADASRVARHLGIPLHEVNLVREYWNHVFLEMLHSYETGLTPNPDVLCNKHIKFDHFFQTTLRKFGADAVATGHYANTSFGPFLQYYAPNTAVRLLQAKDSNKDQTFFLSQVAQEALQRTMFPLAELSKPAVKALALQAGLDWLAHKKESTGMCFIGKRNFKNFIGEYVEPRPGEFVDYETGQVVGQHQGIHLYTLGERAHLFRKRGPAYFIYKKCLKSQIIYVVSGSDHPLLYTDSLWTAHPHWITGQAPMPRGATLACHFRYQHRFPLEPCTAVMSPDGGGLQVQLEVPQRALTPGQFAVFYKNGECLGSAQITDVDQRENLHPAQSTS